MIDDQPPPGPIPPAAQPPYPAHPAPQPQGSAEPKAPAPAPVVAAATGLIGIGLIGGALAAAIGLMIVVPLFRRKLKPTPPTPPNRSRTTRPAARKPRAKLKA